MKLDASATVFHHIAHVATHVRAPITAKCTIALRAMATTRCKSYRERDAVDDAGLRFYQH